MLASGSWGLAWPRPCWAFHLYPWCFLNDASNSTTFAPHAHNNWKNRLRRLGLRQILTQTGLSTSIFDAWSTRIKLRILELFCLRRLGSGGWGPAAGVAVLHYIFLVSFAFLTPRPPQLWNRDAAPDIICGRPPTRRPLVLTVPTGRRDLQSTTGPAKNLACWEKYAAIDRKCATNLGYICKHRTYLSIGNQWCWTILQII